MGDNYYLPELETDKHETVTVDAEEAFGSVIATPGDDLQQKADDAAGGHLHFSPGTFTDVDVSVSSGTRVTGCGEATVLEAPGTGGNVLKAWGSKEGNTSLTSNASEEDTAIDVSDASLFSAEDRVLINSDETSNYRGQTFGEIHEVKDTDTNADTITIYNGGLHDDYTTADNAKATLLDMPSDIHIGGLKITGASGSNYQSGIDLEFATSVTVRDIHVEGLNTQGVVVQSSVDVRVESSRFEDIANNSSDYGVIVSNASRDVTVEGCTFYDVGNHGTSVGGTADDGFPRLIRFVDNRYLEFDGVAADAHLGDDLTWNGNEFSNCNTGLMAGGFTNHIEGNTFSHIAEDAVIRRGDAAEFRLLDNDVMNADNGFNFGSTSNNIKVLIAHNNRFRDIGDNAIWHEPIDITSKLVSIKDNTMENMGAEAIDFESADASTTTVEEFIISNNDIVDTGSNGMNIKNPDSATLVDNLTVSGNTIRRTTGSAINSTVGDNTHITNNTVRNGDDVGIGAWNDEAAGVTTIEGNTVTNCGNHAIFIGQPDAFIANNHLKDNGNEDVDQTTGSGDGLVVINNRHSSNFNIGAAGATVRDNVQY